MQAKPRNQSRRKPWHKRAGSSIAPFVARAVIQLLWKTCKIRQVTDKHHIEPLLSGGEPFIPCYWHQSQIFCVRYLMGLQARGVKLGYLISPSSDGDAATRMFGHLGLHIIRGSATRSGAQALREIYLVIKKDQVSPIITPDGPTGPIFEFKQGVAMLAQLSGAPLLPVSYSASHFWQLKSWDQFVVPRPFSSITIHIGEPLKVDKKLPMQELQNVCDQMSQRLNTLGLE